MKSYKKEGIIFPNYKDKAHIRGYMSSQYGANLVRSILDLSPDGLRTREV